MLFLYASYQNCLWLAGRAHGDARAVWGLPRRGRAGAGMTAPSMNVVDAGVSWGLYTYTRYTHTPNNNSTIHGRSLPIPVSCRKVCSTLNPSNFPENLGCSFYLVIDSRKCNIFRLLFSSILSPKRGRKSSSKRGCSWNYYVLWLGTL